MTEEELVYFAAYYEIKAEEEERAANRSKRSL